MALKNFIQGKKYQPDNPPEEPRPARADRPVHAPWRGEEHVERHLLDETERLQPPPPPHEASSPHTRGRDSRG